MRDRRIVLKQDKDKYQDTTKTTKKLVLRTPLSLSNNPNNPNNPKDRDVRKEGLKNPLSLSKLKEIIQQIYLFHDETKGYNPRIVRVIRAIWKDRVASSDSPDKPANPADPW